MSLAYTYTPRIDSLLKEIERQKVRILTLPLNRTDEAKFRWEKKIDKIFWSLSLTHSVTISRAQVIEVITNTHKKRFP